MILNEFFNLPQVFEKDMNEFDASGYDRYSIYMDDYDLKEKFSDLDDAVEAIEAYKRDDPKSRYADYNVRDLDGKVVWRNDAWQDVPKPGKIQFLPRNDQGVAEGMFGKKKPAEPFEFYLDGCDPHAVKKYLLNKFGSQGWRVAGPGAGTTRVFVAMSPELYPTGNEAKWDIESNCGEQGVAEATGDEKFDTMMGQIQREPKYPDSQMPPTDVKDLYQWAVKNNKPYHKIFAEWANREGYKSVAPALQRAGDLDTEALDYWTPRVWKIYWGEVRGIDSEMPPEWSKKRVPDELRDYLETVFDAYDRIVFDWPTEYRQIGGQDNYAEAKGDYVPPKEANYDDKYQAMVQRVGQKAKQQEKAKQQQPKAPVRESRLALLKQIIQS